MMSLLLCFFIMLYSMSTLQVAKTEAVIESLREGFGYMGSNSSPSDRNANASKQKISATGRSKRLDVMRGGQPVVAPQGEQPLVQSIRPSEESIKGGIIRFDHGSDELNAQGKRDLDDIYSQLVGSPYKILIKGHAAQGEQTGRLVDDKAYARAINVQEYLVTKGLKRHYFQVMEVGPHEPLGRSDPVVQRNPDLANSYVEVILLSSYLRDTEGDKTERNMKYLDNVPMR